MVNDHFFVMGGTAGSHYAARLLRRAAAGSFGGLSSPRPLPLPRPNQILTKFCHSPAQRLFDGSLAGFCRGGAAIKGLLKKEATNNHLLAALLLCAG